MKYDPLDVDFSPTGKLRVRRWHGQFKANAIAAEDLPAGGVVVVDGDFNGLLEVFSKKG